MKQTDVDPRTLAEAVLTAVSARTPPLAVSLLLLDAELDPTDYARYTRSRGYTDFSVFFGVHSDKWFADLAKASPKHAAWCATPGNLGVRPGPAAVSGQRTLRNWDIAHLNTVRYVVDTPEAALAVADAQGLRFPGLERDVAEGKRQLLANDRLFARIASAWATHSDLPGDTPEQKQRAVASWYAKEGAAESLLERQVFKVALLRAVAAMRAEPDGRTLPGVAFSEPAFLYFSKGGVVLPACESRLDEPVGPAAPLGWPTKGGLATWPRRLSPTGVDEMTEIDAKYPYVHKRVAKRLQIKRKKVTPTARRAAEAAIRAVKDSVAGKKEG